MKTTTDISPALACCLEAVYILSKRKRGVRITDISKFLSISKPSVNRAVNALTEHGFTEHEPYGEILLTQKGRYCASQIHTRRNIIKRFLIKSLGIDESVADAEAGSVERHISSETVNMMKKYISAPKPL